MKPIRFFLLALLCSVTTLRAVAVDAVSGATPAANAPQSKPLVVARNGKSAYRIVIASDADSLTTLSAQRLQKYIHQMSGATLPIVDDRSKPAAREIVLGINSRPETNGMYYRELGADGFRLITTIRGGIFIAGGSSRGTLNGIYSLLEHWGCRKYSAAVEVIPSRNELTLPAGVSRVETPAITFRDISYHGTNDQGYIDWHGLSHDARGNKPDWGLWVHTFEQLMPPKQYFANHPEYFAWVGESRATTQPCLSNPAVLEIICENLTKEMARKPKATYWSVSSNDNVAYCRCPACTAIDSIEGSPTGSVIRFVNAVAKRFPDKVISTLAYQYTRAAPLVTRPLPNVNIMFCSIECNRSQPIATDPSSASFRKDMEDWAKLTDNILVWDYVIQFKNLVSPFPNFHVLQPNLQFFVDHHVVAMFEQGNREVGGEFAALRAYVLSKLMWNPQADTDALITDFCNGYYGPGGIFVKQYIDLLTANLIASGQSLNIFGSPIDGAESYLSWENIARYQALFDQAETDTEALQRIRFSRQPLYYAELELAKLDPYGPHGIYVKGADGRWASNPAFTQKLQNFVARCQAEGVTRLSEWHTTPTEYLEMMSRISMVRQEGNLSFEKPVTLTPAPHRKYRRDADKTLTNGIHGTNDYTIQWLGWDQPQFTAIIDLGSQQPVQRATATYLQVLTDWIFLPVRVSFYTSTDGVHYTLSGEQAQPEVNQELAVGMRDFSAPLSGQARYIKVVTEGLDTCPPWHLGAGGRAFAFLDEIVVE